MLFLVLELRTLRNGKQSPTGTGCYKYGSKQCARGSESATRDGWCGGAAVCMLCVSAVALWTGPMDAQITHLWCVCIGHLSIIQKDVLWVPIRPLSCTNQSTVSGNSWDISSKVHSGPVL